MATGKASVPNWSWIASRTSLMLGSAVFGLRSKATTALTSCASAASVVVFGWMTESPGKRRPAYILQTKVKF
jgi:hypothetical protein